MRKITRGASANAGLIFHVFVQDSTSTSGAGKASLAFSDFSCRYIRNGEALSGAITAQDITTIGTYAAPSANTNIRIKAIDNTNAIGLYEVQIHADWVNTTNTCQSLTIFLTASGAATLPIQIPLVADDEQVAKPTNSSLLAIDGSGYVTAASVTGAVGSVTGAVGSVTGAVGSVTGNVGGNVTGSVGSLGAQAKLDVNAEVDTALADYDGPTNAEMEARTILAANYFVVGDYTAPPTAIQNADALLDLTDGVETGVTPRGTLRALLAAMAGVATGGNTTTIVLKNPAGTTTRVTETVDADGNRSAITLNV